MCIRDRNSFQFKNKYRAAKNSLESIEVINNKIIDKVDAELLKYEKNKLEEQLKFGDYNVILFGAGSSGKTSIARALLKNLIGKTSPTIGTTKDINNYKIRIPILKRNINIIDTPGLFEASKSGKKRENCDVDICSGFTDGNGNYAYQSTFHHPYLVGCYGKGSSTEIYQQCSTNPRLCNV